MDWLLRKHRIVRALLLATVFAVVAAALLWQAWNIWHTLRVTPLLHGISGWVWIEICGGGAALCLAAALFALDRPRAGARWFVRWGLDVPRRVLLVAQLGATAVGIAPLGMWLLSYPLPLPK